MGCIQCVPEQRVAVVEQFGKFHSLVSPGCLCLPCPGCVCSVAGLVNLQVQQLNVRIETKSLDNVFVTLVVAVQFQPIPEKVYESYYRLANPRNQINSFVFDVVRSSVPKMELDELFLNKEKIANDVETQLSTVMAEYGFRIRDVLVIDIDPEDKVKAAMNEINANRRLRVAAQEKAEAEKIMVVKKAEADAESKYLNGRGIARQRQAIVEGLQSSVSDFAESKEMQPRDILQLLLISQHFDMVEHVGLNSAQSTLFLSHNPGSIINTGEQIQQMLSRSSNSASYLAQSRR